VRGLPRTHLLIVGGLVAALTAAACSSSPTSAGSSGTSSGSTSGGGTGGPITTQALTRVRAVVSRFTSRPADLGITAKVNSIPRGKTVYYVIGQSPDATVTATAMQAAVTAVGWTYKGVNVQETPQGFQSGFNDALRDPSTSAIVSTSLDTSVVATQLTRARARKIPVVIVTGDNPSSSNAYVIGGPPSLTYAGTLEADYALAKTKGNGQVLIATSLAFPSLNIIANGFKAEWAKMCPACKVPLIYSAPLTSFGSNFPSLLTAYLEAHRSVTYISFGFNDMMIGVGSALQGAGFTSLHSVTYTQGPETNSLYGGVLDASVGFPLYEYSWLAVDLLLRKFGGQDTSVDVNWNSPGSPFSWFVTKDSISTAGLNPSQSWPLDQDYASQFKALWGVS
jgi:ABC-type sugar transport system substrate-binding protein